MKSKWLKESVLENLLADIVTTSIRENSQFQYDSGMSPKIIRKSNGFCCEWCSKLAGVYTYPDVPRDVYKRHQNCTCTVEYDPGDGRCQDVHSRRWVRDEAAIERRKAVGTKEAKKLSGKNLENVTSEYVRNSHPGKGLLVYDEGYEPEKHKKEIITAEWIHKNLGGNIKLLREAAERNRKMPDYLWNEKMWELKNVTTAKAADSAIRHGLKQIKEKPGGIILNYENNEFKINQVISVIEDRVNRSEINEVDIMILTHNKLVRILRYKK